MKDFAFTEGSLDDEGKRTWLVTSPCDLRGPQRTFQRLSQGCPTSSFLIPLWGGAKSGLWDPPRPACPLGMIVGGVESGTGLETEGSCQGSLRSFPISQFGPVFESLWFLGQLKNLPVSVLRLV